MNNFNIILDFVIGNAFWIGLILLYPVWVRLGDILRMVIREWLHPTQKVIIRHWHNHQFQKAVIVDLASDEPLVKQLKKLQQEGSEDGRTRE